MLFEGFVDINLLFLGHEISPDSSVEDVVVILQLELFVRNKFAVFEPMLTHMDSIVQDNNYGKSLSPCCFALPS